ncbi:hypothetical protein [Paenibacillus alvei]|uniref:hypothetical protein n=1 Tax=Paenibacillus alvei TaxID=44250 RepID=UPI0013DBB702|nr:hypothetical protein [Paenibacillus alvei]MBG9733602.1 hypothetical protein [Paenibacillus alvei]MBG9743952.1 hypothetical protein [Paenibacillus alvei]
MSYLQMPVQNQVIYQAGSAALQMIHNMENCIFDLGKQYTGKRVRKHYMLKSPPHSLEAVDFYFHSKHISLSRTIFLERK